MEMEATVATKQRLPGLRYAWLGLGAAVLGPVIYTIQMLAKHLTPPWYALVLATVGLGLSIVALVHARSAWRFVIVGVCGLLAAFQWFVVLASNLPAYTGPVSAGHTLPDFAATLADGTPFGVSDLVGEKNTAMIFFRGRW